MLYLEAFMVIVSKNVTPQVGWNISLLFDPFSAASPDVHLEGHGDDEDVAEDDLHGGHPGRAPRPVGELDPDVAHLPRAHVERPHAGDAAGLGVRLVKKGPC